MTKILLRKQLAEIFRTYLYDAKKNKARSKGTVIAYFVLFALLMVGLLGGMFTFLAFTLRSTIVSGYGWFYYLIFALAAVCIGAFGSVFNTFSGLYLSRDNDLLLSMPIPVHSIMASRLLAVFLMGLMYSGVVSIPAAIALRAGFAAGLLMALCCAAFVFFSTYFALYIGLHNVNLVWTNEINVIKQGSQIILALLAGWAAPVILVLPYMLVLRGKISGEAYIALLTLVLALAAAFFRRWLRTKGADRFENL